MQLRACGCECAADNRAGVRWAVGGPGEWRAACGLRDGQRAGRAPRARMARTHWMPGLKAAEVAPVGPPCALTSRGGAPVLQVQSALSGG